MLPNGGLNECSYGVLPHGILVESMNQIIAMNDHSSSKSTIIDPTLIAIIKQTLFLQHMLGVYIGRLFVLGDFIIR